MKLQCHCGSHAARLVHPPRDVLNCHCGFCRALSGAAFTTWASFRPTDIVVEQDGPLHRYAASIHATRCFCPACGTHVMSLDSRLPDTIGVPAGIIAGNLPPVRAHYFVSDKAAWVSWSDDLPCYGGTDGFTPV
jgi:hypothetical protein